MYPSRLGIQLFRALATRARKRSITCARVTLRNVTAVPPRSLDPRPSASLRYTLAHKHITRVTFEPCAVVRWQKAWKIFIT